MVIPSIILEPMSVRSGQAVIFGEKGFIVFFCYMKEFEGKTYFPKQCLKIQHGENMAILQKTTKIRKISFAHFFVFEIQYF